MDKSGNRVTDGRVCCRQSSVELKCGKGLSGFECSLKMRSLNQYIIYVQVFREAESWNFRMLNIRWHCDLL